MSQPETSRFVILNLKALTWVATFSFYGSWDSRAPATFAKSDYGIRSGLSWTFGNRQQQSVDRFNSGSFMTRIILPGIYFAKRLKWAAGFVGPWCTEHGWLKTLKYSARTLRLRRSVRPKARQNSYERRRFRFVDNRIPCLGLIGAEFREDCRTARPEYARNRAHTTRFGCGTPALHQRRRIRWCRLVR